MRTITRGPTAIGAAVAGIMAVSAVGCAVSQPENDRGGTGSVQQDTLRWSVPEEFAIGTAVAGGGHHLSQPYPDPFSYDEEYGEVLALEFNSVSPENQMKWEFVQPQQGVYDFGAADAIVAFAEENGQDVRGHTLLWHSQNPAWLEQGDFTAEELREILRDHLTTVVSRYAGRVDQWDVANEIVGDDGALRMQENIWLRELGTGIIADAFRWAHEADPDALLFFNDYGVESIGPKSDVYYTLIQDLLSDGVPVHGFSTQGHLDMQWAAPGDMEGNLQRFADLGLETAVTEVDVRMDVIPGQPPSPDQLEKQAGYYRTMLEQCLAVEGCSSFTVWGFTDKYSWVPVFFPQQGAATIMDEELNRKPAYYALREALD